MTWLSSEKILEKEMRIFYQDITGLANGIAFIH